MLETIFEESEVIICPTTTQCNIELQLKAPESQRVEICADYTMRKSTSSNIVNLNSFPGEDGDSKCLQPKLELN